MVFDGLQFTDVTTHTEIFLLIALLVVEGDEVELQVQGMALTPDGGLHVGMDAGGGLVVHVVQDALRRFLPLRVDQVQHPGLCQGEQGAVGLVEEGERVGGQVILYHLDTTDLQDVVDILDIRRYLVVGLLQLLDVLQHMLIGLGHLRHVTTCAEDGEQLPFGIAHRGQLQLVVELAALQHLVQRPTVLPLIDLRHVHPFEVFHVEVGLSQHVFDGDLHVFDHLHVCP